MKVLSVYYKKRKIASKVCTLYYYRALDIYTVYVVCLCVCVCVYQELFKVFAKRVAAHLLQQKATKASGIYMCV